ncbi:MAG: prepilin-type N-terminal cleavage/methylation domain-containing protein [Desulfurivibrionaceae bacterium]|jgi:prepilin-type N-terminal cleavage/methylation domain-containing protein
MILIMGKKGFTLVEVMVATVIFAIGFLATLAMMTGATGGNKNSRVIGGAAEVAAQWMETLTSLTYTSIATDPLLVDPPGATNGIAFIRNPLPSIAQVQAVIPFTPDLPNPGARPADNTRTTPDGQYTIYWNVADNTPIPDTKTIMVIVTSTGWGLDAQRTVALQSIIPRR